MSFVLLERIKEPPSLSYKLLNSLDFALPDPLLQLVCSGASLRLKKSMILLSFCSDFQ